MGGRGAGSQKSRWPRKDPTDTLTVLVWGKNRKDLTFSANLKKAILDATNRI